MDDLEIEFQAANEAEQAPVLVLEKKKKKSKKKKKAPDDTKVIAAGDEAATNVTTPLNSATLAKDESIEKSSLEMPDTKDDAVDPKRNAQENGALVPSGEGQEDGNEAVPELNLSKKKKKKKKKGKVSQPTGFAAFSSFNTSDEEDPDVGDAEERAPESLVSGFASLSMLSDDQDTDDKQLDAGSGSERTLQKQASKKNIQKKKSKRTDDEDIDAIIASLDSSTRISTESPDPSSVTDSKMAPTKVGNDDIDDILKSLDESTPSSSKKAKKKKKRKGKAGDGQPSNLQAGSEEFVANQQASEKDQKQVNEEDPQEIGLETRAGSAEKNNNDDLLASLGLGGETSETKAPSTKKKKKKTKKTQSSKVRDEMTKEEASSSTEKKKPKRKESAAIRRLREDRAKMLAEQERLEKLAEEEEARIAAEEEAAKQASQIKEEARRRKKEADRLKRERLRKEGKLLSKGEKEKRRRAEAARKMFESQGLVPETDEKVGGSQKRVVYGRKKKRKESNQEEDGSNRDVNVRTLLQAPENKEVSAPLEPEDDLEDWEALSRIDDIAESLKNTSAEEASEKESDEEEEESSSGSEDEYEGMSREEIAVEKRNDRYRARRQKLLDSAMEARSTERLRSPIICIMGHVDTGKTKILDRIRRTNVQDGEAGGITQQIGATFFPIDAVIKQANKLDEGRKLKFDIPALLIIDTPGHESFTNLRSRGSSLCDLAILVVDIMHGLEPQTMESIELLKIRKTPFIVALNKIDRMFDWKAQPGDCPVRDALAAQPAHVRDEFDRRVQETQLAFAKIGFNTEVYWKNDDVRKTLSLVPTSAITGEGMPDLLMLLVSLSQKLLTQRLMFSSIIECTILEVKVIEGHGTTIDVILTGGKLRAGDVIAVAGLDGPIIATIRALLTPHAMKEMRVKGQYLNFDEIEAAQGIKIAADGLEKAVAGTQLLVAENPEDLDEIEFLKQEVMKDFDSILQNVDKSGMGVYVQASTLGSLEALLDFLRASKIRVSGINIGPVHKRDVTKASTMLEKQQEYATILAFDVPVEREAKELAEEVGVKIFTADIIYHLFDQFTAYMEEVRKRRREEINDDVVFPSILEIIPTFVFNKKDPIVVGVDVKQGILRVGTPLVVKKSDGEWLDIGRVTSIELNKKSVTLAHRSASVAIKIEGKKTENIMYGRHFDNTDPLVSKMSRKAIDLLKENFRDDLQTEDWRLVVKLKTMFKID